MIISPSKRLVYIGPPKTASTSLHRYLERLLGDNQTDWRKGQQHSADVPASAAEYFCFASIRHPFDRAVSLWRHSQLGGRRQGMPRMSFAEFVAWLEVDDSKPFYRWSLCRWLQPAHVDAFVRVEQLAVQLRVILGDSMRGTIPHANKTAVGPAAAHYNDDLEARVHALFADDFERWEWPNA